MPKCAGCRRREATIVELKTKIAALDQWVAEQGRRLAELESRVKTNSSNSSLPSDRATRAIRQVFRAAREIVMAENEFLKTKRRQNQAPAKITGKGAGQ